MVTLGVDPGIERCGIGIVQKEGSKLRLIFHKLIKTSSKLSTAERLKIIYSELLTVISRFQIDHGAVERLFFAKNTKTAMVVSEARGVIQLALINSGLPVYEYTPLQIKQALTGYGNATKEQIQKVISKLIITDSGDGSNDFETDDVADAVAIAITHINTYKIKERLAKFK